MKRKRMGLAWESWKGHTAFWSDKLKEGDHLGDFDVDEGLILKWI
jgi:hypothetical protein